MPKKKLSKAKSNYKKNKVFQMSAVLAFGISLFFFAFAFIEGESLWFVFRNFFFGVFGIGFYFFPFFVLYVSFLISKIEVDTSVKFKLIQLFLLFLTLCGLLQSFFGKTVLNKEIFDIINNFYNQGVNMHGAGFFGFITFYPLYIIFGSTPATITLAIIFVVLLMFFSGKTLKDFADVFKKHSELKKQKKLKLKAELDKEDLRLKNRSKNKIDVDIDDIMPPHPVKSEICSDFIKNNNKSSIDINIDDIIVNNDIQNINETEIQEIMPPIVNKTSEEVVDKSENEEINNEPLKPLWFANNGKIMEYKYPSINLLDEKSSTSNIKSEELKLNAEKLIETLKSFGVKAKIIEISKGPVVTRYEIQPDIGVKISKITSLADDIALSLAASGIRIEAPIPNKAAIGIEVPNKNVDVVKIRDIISSKDFKQVQSKLSVCLGKDIAGKNVVTDLKKMPHILVAGATGSGKSVCINTFIISILYNASPDEVKILMIDPKVVELGIYNGIPHLLVPVVTDPKKASGALGWAVAEMLKRYKLFADSNVRDLEGYNKLANSNPEIAKLPQILIIIDELADLMMSSPKEIEDYICRLAQMARAAGMHLIIATQRPSVDVITGIIKANIPSRIAFSVSSQVDSRTILDSAGAEKLLGRGDMLYYPVGSSKPTRVQGCFINDQEVERIVNFIKRSSQSNYDDEVIEEIEQKSIQVSDSSSSTSSNEGAEINDPVLKDAIELAVDLGQMSTSLLQRKLRLGYARAARIVDTMEDMGIVGGMDGSKPRQVLISRQQWIEMSLNKNNDV